jgi:hypothetical protein
VALINGLALADHREREMRQRGEIAARPDRALFGNHGMNPAREHLQKSLSDERTRAAIAERQHIGA